MAFFCNKDLGTGGRAKSNCSFCLGYSRYSVNINVKQTNNNKEFYQHFTRASTNYLLGERDGRAGACEQVSKQCPSVKPRWPRIMGCNLLDKINPFLSESLLIMVSSQQQRSKHLLRVHSWSRTLWGAFSGKESATQLWDFLRGVLT